MEEAIFKLSKHKQSYQFSFIPLSDLLGLSSLDQKIYLQKCDKVRYDLMNRDYLEQCEKLKKTHGMLNDEPIFKRNGEVNYIRNA